jgi:chitodextrinase
MTYQSGGLIEENDIATILYGPDTTVPSAPTGLTATAISSSQINLSWAASTDDRRVAQYQIYRNSSLIATIGNVTVYSNTGLTSGTLYSYYVVAVDSSNNLSTQSNNASATTF